MPYLHRLAFSLAFVAFFSCTNVFSAAEMSLKVKTIVAAMDKAVDPDKRGEKIKSFIVTSEAQLPQQQINITCVSKFKSPNKMISEISIPGVMETKECFDGEFGWLYSPAMGLVPAAGNQLLSMKFMAKMSSPASKFANIYTKIELAPKSEKVNGLDCYKLVCTIPKEYNMPPALFYVDKKSYLVRKSEITVTTMMGQQVVPVEITKYKKQHGIMWPAETVMNSMGMKMVLKLNSVKINCKIPDKDFKAPEVKNNQPAVPAMELMQ